MFPIKSYDGTLSLEYICYDLGRARYSEEDCRRLRLTYGRPLRARLRLNKPNGAIQEDVYLGDIPIMIGGGEFIVNGAQRVIVAQLHRSPGVDFQEDTRTTEKRLHSCRIIPERGSWIEIDVSRKDVLYIRVDQSGRFPITCFIRALSPDFSTNADIIRQFYETEFEEIPARGGAKLRHRYSAEEIVDPATGEVVVSAGQMITDDIVPRILALERKRIRVIAKMDDALILNTLNEETSRTHEEALLHIYGRLRPGNPPSIERAKELFHERFLDPDRYRLGPVGRFRLNRKFNQNVPMDAMMLHPDDIINAVRYIIGLRRNEGHVDDIDHLGNRRLRTIDELAGDELRKGFLKLRRTVQERMGTSEPAELTPRSLVNSKTISAAIEFFFGRSELSQVVEQTNPLHQLTHERKLSALGPGGLNRKRAGFEVRDVHISHYGRICPIETPEGANIGLITSLGIYAGVDDYGFIVTPYRRVKNGVVTDEIVQLRADEEIDRWMGPADLRLSSAGKIVDAKAISRRNGDFLEADPKTMEYADVAPNQIVGVSASLIPFLEHNDANRALMGSNMQKQAVPLLRTEPRDGHHRHGEGSRPQLQHGRARRGERRGRRGGRRPHHRRRAQLSPAEIQRAQREDLPQPEADRAPRPEGQEGRDHRRRRRHRRGRTGPRQERPRRLHALGRLQLRGRHPDERAPRRGGQDSPRSTSRSSRSNAARPSWARRSSPATSPTCPSARWRTSMRKASSASAPTCGPATSSSARSRRSPRPS